MGVGYLLNDVCVLLKVRGARAFSGGGSRTSSDGERGS